ncbi:hypothetical protein PENTCL1PPCAC_13434 [Pristionchus entomophagus]|uniref:Cytochrome P450 n=1 Tax=Pristionchus entomophagus TaxID=358040 RepID=A0AAV5TC00_9BILA|nr:hypothetical protein PENTCL1PPCAC_13434 [Pristionchus entomophagus]
MSALLLLFIVGAITYAVWKYYSFTSKFPSGPRPLPFIGNVHQVDFASKRFSRFADKFNGLYTLFTPIATLEITDYALIKEAFIDHGDDYVDRMMLPGMEKVFNYCKNGGVINSSGDNWREQRRVSLSILRDFGMGKNVMEELVRNSVAEYLRCLANIKDKEIVNMRWPIQLMIANIINEVLFGYRYKYDECDDLINYVEGFNKMISELATNKLLPLAIAFPSVKYVPILGYYAVEIHAENVRKNNEYIVRNVAKALESFDTEGDPTNFVHAYKQRMSSNAYLDQDNLIATCADFFSAGQETTTTTLRWATLFLAKNQQAQDKLREEVHRVVGKERLPALEDKNKMIYTQATIHEIQRLANILRLNVFRKTHQPTTLAGQTIPENMTIHADIHYVMWNDPHFENPKEFRPERYIAEDGKSLRKELVERTIPFSLGKRACAGEGLARVELFLGLTATVQNYRILPIPGQPIDLTQQEQTIGIPIEQMLRLESVL